MNILWWITFIITIVRFITAFVERCGVDIERINWIDAGGWKRVAGIVASVLIYTLTLWFLIIGKSGV